MKNKALFKIVYCGIMAAMSFVCTLFEIPLIINITLYGIPLIFVGILYGPGYGALVGFVAGFLEQLKWGITLQSFLWILAPHSWGGLSGLIYLFLNKLFGNKKIYINVINYSVAIIVAAIIANIANSFALVVYGYSSTNVENLKMFIAYAIPRLVSIPIHVLIYIPVCYIVCEKIKKILVFEE